jgi:hypothetical protein
VEASPCGESEVAIVRLWLWALESAVAVCSCRCRWIGICWSRMQVVCRVKRSRCNKKRGDVVIYVEGEGEKKRCEVKSRRYRCM